MTDITVTTSVCLLFESLFTPEKVKFDAPLEEQMQLLNMLFLFSFAWSLGGSCDSASMAKMNTFLSQRFADIKPPGSLFEYWVDYGERKWHNWEEIVPPFSYSSTMAFFDMLVPTIDTGTFWLLQL